MRCGGFRGHQPRKPGEELAPGTARRRTVFSFARLALSAVATVFLAPALLFQVPAAPEKPDAEIPAEKREARVRILGINDLHGNLEPPGMVGGEMTGGAAYLASYLERHEEPGRTVRVHAGDMVGASPMISGYFEDEPTVRAMNLMGFDVGTIGNHELDAGVEEMLRIVEGGPRSAGADFPYLAANTLDARTGKPVLPPYEVLERDGVRVGFIGVTTLETPEMLPPDSTASLRFRDISETVNQYAAELQERGVEAIVVLAHAGGARTGSGPTGEILEETAQMSAAVDVVVAGHTHTRLNERVGGKLVVEAGEYGTALGVVDLVLDRGSGDVLRSEARIVTTRHEGIRPDPRVEDLVSLYAEKVAEKAERVVGTASADLTTAAARSGQSVLGNLIADAHRSAAGADFAVVNSGSIRGGVEAGPVTYGDLYAVRPSEYRLVEVELTGEQVYRLLEQQFTGKPRTLQVSGLRYFHDPSRRAGERVTEVTHPDGTPVSGDSTYTLVANEMLAAGGLGFTVLQEGREVREVGGDLEALVGYVEGLPRLFNVPNPAEERRITLSGDRG